MSKQNRSILLLLLVAAIWGFAPPIIKDAFHYLPWDLFLTYRFFLTCLVMLPFLFIKEPSTLQTLKLLTSSDRLLLFLCGILGSTLQLGLLFWGLSLTTSLDGSIINAMSPVFVALAGHYFLKEKVSPKTKAGLFMAFIGSLIIILQPFVEGQPLFSGSVMGNVLVLLGTFAWVGYVILTKIALKEKLSPLFLTTNMFVIGFLSMLVFILFRYDLSSISHKLLAISFFVHLSVIYMAFISGALAYFLYQYAQKSLTVTKANIFLYLPPVFTAPLAFFWLKEPITLPLIIGSLIIILGVVIVEKRRPNLLP